MIVLVVLIVIESKLYPDTKTIEAELNEDRHLIDKPYTCMLNPLLPAVGIMFSSLTLGYMD